ncbi:MAG: hypothetical protein IID32_09795 [Planctomycetes bacterium]|nr:hypothetical protein [Planctomycetota bacterium]
MAATRGSSGESSALLYTMIVFIVLFLASTVVAVMQFMKTEQLRRDRDIAETRFSELATTSEYNLVKPLVVKSGRTVRSTAIGQITADMRYLAQLVGGVDMVNMDILGAREEIGSRIEMIVEAAEATLFGPEGRGALSPNEEESVVSLVTVIGELNDALGSAQADMDSLMIIRDTREMNDSRTIAQQKQQIAEMSGDLTTAAKKSQALTEQYDQLQEDQAGKYQKVIDDLNTRIEQAGRQLQEGQTANTTMAGQVAQLQQGLSDLRERLKLFQPTPETEMAALEADGYVVSVIAEDKIAYINLNKKDHIYRGMTFTVYDSYESIPKSGKGKGSLEVVEIMDSISKCRIWDYDPTNPITERDLLANLIWDKDKRYLFCVSGDFDFDGDGVVDPDGGSRIMKMVEAWGGQATSSLSVDTDFLILGQPPEIPERPSEEEIDSNSDSAVAYNRAIENSRLYNEVLVTGAALGVPTFNRDRFLYFIGYYQQAKSPL